MAAVRTERTRQPFRQEWGRLLAVSACAGWLLDAIGGTLAGSLTLRAPWVMRTLAATGNLVIWALVLALPTAVMLQQGRADTPRLWRGVLRVAGASFLWMLGFFEIINWIFYSRRSEFFGWSDLAFLQQNFQMVLLHLLQVEPANLALACAGSMCLAVGAIFLVPRLSRGSWCIHPIWRTAFRSAFAGGSVALFSASLVVMHHPPAPDVAWGSTDVMWQQPLPRYVLGHVGPINHLLRDGLERLRGAEKIAPPMPESLHIGFPPPSAEESEPAVPDQRIRHLAVREAKRIRSLSAYVNAPGVSGAEPHNVIVVFVESMRADRLRKFGARRDVMPNLDRLSERAVLAAVAYAQSSQSIASDTSLLSSQYPLRPDTSRSFKGIEYPRVLLYDVLKARGYQTALFSSQNEMWGGMLRFLDTGGLDTIFHAEMFPGPTYVPMRDERFWWFCFSRVPLAGKVPDRETLERALAWMQRRSDKPFFLALNFQSSHFPYVLPADAATVFLPVDLPASPLGLDRVTFNDYPLNHAAVMENRYDNSLHYIDQLLGKLVDRLEALGMMDRTVLVVVGDNGELLGEHGEVTHAGPLWEEAIRTPLVILAPRAPVRHAAGLVQHIDIPPTVLDLLGLPPHPAFQGRSHFAPAAHSTIYSMIDTIHAEQAVVIRDGYKLFHDWRDGSLRLYNLQDDPGESRDIAGQNPWLTAELRGRLQRWYASQRLYYTSPDIFRQYYPPSLEEEDEESLSIFMPELSASGSNNIHQIK